MKARDLMSRPPVVVRGTDSLADAARLMVDHAIGALPVVNGQGALVGILTESDYTMKDKGVPFSLFRAPSLFDRWFDPRRIEEVYDAAASTAVREIMTANVTSVDADASLHEVLRLMLEHDVHRIPVAEAGRVVGMIARHDLLRLMSWREHAAPVMRHE
jgi:CBS domain-containing protein